MRERTSYRLVAYMGFAFTVMFLVFAAQATDRFGFVWNGIFAVLLVVQAIRALRFANRARSA